MVNTVPPLSESVMSDQPSVSVSVIGVVAPTIPSSLVSLSAISASTVSKQPSPSESKSKWFRPSVPSGSIAVLVTFTQVKHSTTRRLLASSIVPSLLMSPSNAFDQPSLSLLFVPDHMPVVGSNSST